MTTRRSRISPAGIADGVGAVALLERNPLDAGGIRGHGHADLWSPEAWAEHEAHRLEQFQPGAPIDPQRWAEFAAAHEGDLAHLEFTNLITQIGDEYYGERAAGIASPPAQVTGMQLGTGTTAVAKTGAGAAVVTYISGSNVAIDGSFPTSSLQGSSRRIQWKTTWGAGVATQNGIAEVVLINQSIATNAAAAAADTIARALLSPTVNKGASDTLAVTWNHDLLGA